MRIKLSNTLQKRDKDEESPDMYNFIYFDVSRFPWLRNAHTSSENRHLGTVYRRGGVLKSQDLYCLKLIESSTSPSTLIWFLNYMMRKELQSQYKHLKSCLVPELGSSNPFMNCYSEYKETVINERFEVRVEAKSVAPPQPF